LDPRKIIWIYGSGIQVYAVRIYGRICQNKNDGKLPQHPIAQKFQSNCIDFNGQCSYFFLYVVLEKKISISRWEI
jgi:hypothetical protein